MKDDVKPGSHPEKTDQLVSDKDFGAAETDVTERNYVSEETKRNDPGKSTARSGTGPRTSGVGGNDSGPGSSSGGDVDVGNNSLVGIGDPHQQTVSSPRSEPSPVAEPLPRGSVMPADPTRAGALDNDSSTSAADVNNETEHGDPAFKGDITADEATGNSSR